MERVVLRAAWVLPVSSPPIPDAEVRVGSTGLIEAVGPAADADGGDVRILDLGNAAILPGLVNVHAHPELTVLRGKLEDLPFVEWLKRITQQKYDVLTAEALRASTWLGVAEAIAAGVTCLAGPDDAGFMLEALRESGLRGRVYREVFGPAPEQVETALSETRGKVDSMRAVADDRIDVGISPHAPYTVSAELFGELSKYATAEDLPVCIHVAESEIEESFIRDGSGPLAERLRDREIKVEPQAVSPIEWVERTGIFETRPLLVHCIRVDSADISRIADSGASVAHCPISNAKFAHGIAPLPAFIEAGIPVGLGSDSVASNNRVGILEEARFAALLQRSIHHDPTLLGSSDLLRLATLGGAAALGLDDRIGSLEPGKHADLIAVRFDAPHLTPMADPVAALFHSAGGSDVMLTVVGGRVLYREGKFATLDWDALARSGEQTGGGYSG